MTTTTTMTTAALAVRQQLDTYIHSHTHAEIALAMQVTPGYISSIACGRRMPKAPKIQRLARAAGIDMDELTTELRRRYDAFRAAERHKHYNELRRKRRQRRRLYGGGGSGSSNDSSPDAR